MKKSKPVSLHNIKSSSPSLTKKKSPITIKQKPSKPSSITIKKKQQPSSAKQPVDYIIIGDNIYSANTFTERNSYDNFLSTIKREKQEQRKSFLFKQNIQDDKGSRLKKSSEAGGKNKRKFRKLSPQDFIQTMTLEEKRQMLIKLEQEIKSSSVNHARFQVDLPLMDENNKLSQPCSTESFEHDLSKRMDSERQSEEKFRQLEEKLETLKMQLIFKWEGQLEKLQQLYNKGKVTQKQKDNKTLIIEKLKDHKLKIIQCTKTLFEKILKEDSEQNEQEERKNNKIEAILQSLHSFPSLESLADERVETQPNIDHLKVKERQLKDEQRREKGKEEVRNTAKDMGLEMKIIENRSIGNLNNIDSSALQIVEDMGREAFLDELKQHQVNEIQTKKIRQREQLVSPLNFMGDSSPQQRMFGEYDEIKTVVEKEFSNLPTKSEEMLKELLELGDSKGEMNKSSYNKENMGQVKGNLQSEKLSLKLDLRLDEIVLGQDEYPQCEKQQHFQTKDVRLKLDLKVQQRLQKERQKANKKKSLIQFRQQDSVQELSDSRYKEQIAQIAKKDSIKIEQPAAVENKPQIIQQEEIHQQLQLEGKQQLSNGVVPVKEHLVNIQTIDVNSVSSMTSLEQEPVDESLACHEAVDSTKPTIDIPLILSQEKMETLALEQNRLFRENIDRRVAFQMGCIELQPSELASPVHFTTLVDINSYIVGFYEFMMRKYMNSLVDNLNIPYGKSAVDKLYSLHVEGFVLQQAYNPMNNILSESHFLQYQREMTLTMRKCSQFETAHNRAVFEAFTKCVNVYRPYYELEGEVYPWIVSEKGITFYEITEDNIEEVFEKSKIKVLEYCTSLCGLHPPSQIKNDEQLNMVNGRNEENLNKTIKTETLELFDEWKVRFVNFDCLVRMLVGKVVVDELVAEAVKQMHQIYQGCLLSQS